jgi:hypothetical protein
MIGWHVDDGWFFSLASLDLAFPFDVLDLGRWLALLI